MLRPAVIFSLVVSLNSSALASTGATVPWITYEAENGTYAGSLRGPSYSLNTVEAESSGRQCVRLSATGQYVQFTAVSNATAVVVRYSVPDTAGGGGTDYTLSLYKNGALVGRLPVTSKYSWLYGAYPFNNTPGYGPRNFFDEARTNGVPITAGDVIKIQKDSVDTASYYDVDLVDLENVAAAASQPGGFVSIKSAPYNAAGNGVNDDTSALQNCINNNSSVWIPPGTYKVTGSINVPSNKIIRGAGIWYSTLVGDASLYGTANRRVTMNGNGNNIQLSDFAMIGKLNYRSDNEANDGLGGKYGTGSTISNVWVEHTKTGAWIVNSQGLVVNNCRFRNTIADGINVCVGMRSTTVTNCTARGTGDDCFAIWPATYTAAVYAPGLNVIKNCTGQLPFLANGGAIYGGESNRIEDCLFQDMPDGCGVLLSTTFTVSTNFGGTTVVRRSDLNRCGGSRAGLEIYMEKSGISGVNLSELTITNSITHGLRISLGAGGGLSNAILSDSAIPNYGIGGSGGMHGLWARNDSAGSLTVSNCAVAEYKDDSPNFTFYFLPNTNAVITVQSNLGSPTFAVDGTEYTATQVFNWIPGSTHTIATTTPQSGGTETQIVWNSWSDGGAISHTVAPSNDTTYTANFTKQYYVTMNAGANGSVTPASGWKTAGTLTNITATAADGYVFTSWTGAGNGSYSGADNPAWITMNAPITQTANFVPAILITVQPNPLGRTITVDGTDYTNAQTFSWAPYSVHTIAATLLESGGAGTQHVWNSWSDRGAYLHYVAPQTNMTYTADFTTQYYLTMTAGANGSVSPASGWTNAGAIVSISAAATNGYALSSWTGSGDGSYSGADNPTSITMNGLITQAATFAPGISITVQPNPSGKSFTVDGTAYTDAQTFSWIPNSSHTIAATSPQNGGAGIQHVWSSWSDGGAMSHNISPGNNETYTANFTTQYYLTMVAGAGGSVGPGADWYDSGTNLNITATALGGYMFHTWTGTGSGSYSGANNPAWLTINGPITQTAGFAVLPEILGFTISDDGTATISYATVSGLTYHVETTTNLMPAAWTTIPGSPTNADGGVIIFVDPNGSGDPQRFYRVGSP